MKIIREPRIDTVPEDVYRYMYDAMRETWTLREFVEQTESALSIAYWSKYYHGNASLSIASKNDLRRGWNKTGKDEKILAMLPETPLALLAEIVDENAQIVQEGDGVADKIVLFAKGADDAYAKALRNVRQRPVAAVTATEVSEGEPASPRRRRSADSSIDVPADLRSELNYLRRERGWTWLEFLQEAKRVMSICAHSHTAFVVLVDGDHRQEAQICQDCGEVRAF
jgi:hypothetical protein